MLLKVYSFLLCESVVVMGPERQWKKLFCKNLFARRGFFKKSFKLCNGLSFWVINGKNTSVL